MRVDEICENICEISVESMRAGSQMQVRVAINSHPHYPHYLLAELNTFSGTPELGGGQEGQPPLLPFTRRARRAKEGLSI